MKDTERREGNEKVSKEMRRKRTINKPGRKIGEAGRRWDEKEAINRMRSREGKERDKGNKCG